MDAVRDDRPQRGIMGSGQTKGAPGDAASAVTRKGKAAGLAVLAVTNAEELDSRSAARPSASSASQAQSLDAASYINAKTAPMTAAQVPHKQPSPQPKHDLTNFDNMFWYANAYNQPIRWNIDVN